MEKISKLKEKYFPYLMCTPAIVLFTVLIIVPLFTGLIISFFKWDGYGAMSFNAGENYLFVFQDEVYKTAIGNTFVYAIAVTIFKNLIALVLAFILVKKFPLKNFFRSGIYMPVMMSYIVIGILWTWIFNPTFGLLNSFLNLVGLDSLIKGWLSDPSCAMWSVIAVDVWKWIGYHMVLYIAGLQGISQDYYEAAEIDGASAWQKFKNITIPLLNPTIVVNVMMSITGGLVSNYDIVHIMTDGGPFHATEVSATYIMRTAFTYGNMGKANAMTMITFAIAFIFGFIQLYFMTRKESEEN